MGLAVRFYVLGSLCVTGGYGCVVTIGLCFGFVAEITLWMELGFSACFYYV